MLPVETYLQVGGDASGRVYGRRFGSRATEKGGGKEEGSKGKSYRLDTGVL